MAEQVEATRGSNQSIAATTKPYRSRKPDINKLAVTKKMLFLVILAWLIQIIVWTGYNLKNVNGGYSNLDEVRAVAREIVREEIERHAADGLGRVDYALAAGGGYVTKHSQADSAGIGSVWFSRIGRNGVHVNSVKMLRPSFGEPGDCFVLNGSSGFVEIKLRKAIVPQAVTLEHVAKSVAYDRSSAPKDCRVSGWFGEKETDAPHNTEKMISLGEFTYDLEKSNAQTFDVSLPEDGGIGVVDTIRLDFTSNHGSATHTSIYRFRVHGQEPDSSVPLANSFFSNLKNLIL